MTYAPDRPNISDVRAPQGVPVKLIPEVILIEEEALEQIRPLLESTTSFVESTASGLPALADLMRRNGWGAPRRPPDPSKVDGGHLGYPTELTVHIDAKGHRV